MAHVTLCPQRVNVNPLLQVSAVDEKTRLILYRLVNQELLESINGVISTGKEAVVLHAVGGRSVEVIHTSQGSMKVTLVLLSVSEFYHALTSSQLH